MDVISTDGQGSDMTVGQCKEAIKEIDQKLSDHASSVHAPTEAMQIELVVVKTAIQNATTCILGLSGIYGLGLDKDDIIDVSSDYEQLLELVYWAGKMKNVKMSAAQRNWFSRPELRGFVVQALNSAETFYKLVVLKDYFEIIRVSANSTI